MSFLSAFLRSGIVDVPPPSEDASVDARLLFAIAAFGLATLMIVYVRRRRRAHPGRGRT